MSNVTLAIGGRDHIVSCGPGQEARIEELGRTIDAKLSALPNLAGQSETRTLLFAALLLADEVYELRGGGTRAAPKGDGAKAAETLETIAERLESLAEQLEA
jgi:cell division protein ZapA